MNESIRNVEGIGSEYQSKLEYVGIKTVSELLAKTVTQESRDELSKRSHIPVGFIDNWASMLDLTRVEGVGYQYAELLTYSGIKSVEDFRKRNPQDLHKTLKEINDEKHFTSIVPSAQMLDGLIQSSKSITNVVERY